MTLSPRSAARLVEKPIATREKLRKSLFSWYDQAERALPWRVRGALGDPYRVWLSEVMLQQTRAAAVAGYYAKFLELWPDVAALANASRADVLAAWAGLGYYARARNLHAAAARLATEGFPTTEAGWRALPGVGPYSAAAIAAIACGQPTNPVDGNVERVMARFYAVEAQLPGAKRELRRLAGELAAPDRAGDWAQALMDLGALVCTPRRPSCGDCPWAEDCAARAAGDPQTYPRRAPKTARPQRFGAAFRITGPRGLWLVRRPDGGLLGGMPGLPTTPWRERAWSRAQALRHAPVAVRWEKVGAVRHLFTHFALTLDVYAADAGPEGDGWWGKATVLPTLFRKAASI